jgi:hypothetical protein
MNLRDEILAIIARANREVAKQPEAYRRSMAAWLEPDYPKQAKD